MKRFYYLFAALLLMPSLAFAQLIPCEPFTGELLISSPDDIAGDYVVGTPAGDASWPDTSALVRPGVTGEVVIARSPGGTGDPASDPDELCEEPSNAADLAGNIALIRRGACAFSVKALFAQEAGAIGAIIYNDERVADDDMETILNMGGTSPSGKKVNIATVFAARAVGLQIVSQIEDFENTVLAQLQYDACVQVPVANEDTGVVNSREISAAYPNPFASRTQFDLSVEETQEVSVRVFNVLGQEVATLHEGVLPAGTQHTFTFEAASLPAGVYLYRVVGETFASTRQVTLVR